MYTLHRFSKHINSGLCLTSTFYHHYLESYGTTFFTYLRNSQKCKIFISRKVLIKTKIQKTGWWEKVSRFLSSEHPCRDFVRVEVALKKNVEIFLVSRFCPVEILSCRDYDCRDFVSVEILSLSRFCPCRDFVRDEIMSCRDSVLVPWSLFSVQRRFLFPSYFSC